ncbi:MAG TPA: CHASE3 domain-containing protein [Longimicrobiales bacterium]|nr:CHASE3 domain-containing protein [Longimicrobiales bacterium]
MALTTAEKINVGFVAGIAIVVLIGAVSYRAMTRSLANAAAVAETHEVLASLQRTQSLLLDAESAQRGYIITGDHDYLARFQSAHREISRELVRLRELRLADTEGTGRLSRLGTLIAQRMAMIREGITAYDASGPDAAGTGVFDGAGREVMDTVRALATSLERRERVLLQERSEQAELSARSAQAVVVGSALFGLLLVLLSTHLIRRDITDRQRVESALRESEAVLGQFMESLPVGAYVIDAAGRPRFANTAARALLGRGIVPDALPEDMNQTYQIHRAGTDSLYPASELPLVQALAGFRSTIDDAEVHRNGHVVPVAVSAAPIYDVTGRVAYAIAVFSDITGQRRSEEALRAARDSAEAANRTKSEFLARMSHELRTPLNSVIGFANILLRNKGGNLRPQDMVYLERINENGGHLLTLINDVLDLSKIEAGKIELEITTFSLSELIDEVLRQWDGQMPAGLALRAEVPGGIAPIDSDRARLKQVLINLVSNAVKFTERGHVTVKVDAEAFAPRRILVSDTGIGIEADRLGPIFEAFEQAESSTARRYGGTGLGLPISRRLCHLLGYSLEVESQVGSGTTFTIDLAPPEPPRYDEFDAHDAPRHA